jgi:hypothetical protein
LIVSSIAGRVSENAPTPITFFNPRASRGRFTGQERTKMNPTDRPSAPSALCNPLANPTRRERRRFHLLEVIDRVCGALAKPPVLAAVELLLMWFAVSLVSVVIGGYAGPCRHDEQPRFQPVGPGADRPDAQLVA